jgi:hypothetical protein
MIAVHACALFAFCSLFFASALAQTANATDAATLTTVLNALSTVLLGVFVEKR